MGTTFNLDPDDVIMTSAKKGLGIEEVLQAIVDHLPSPGKIFYKLFNKNENLI
jgi:translation elongation factor EF-4